MMTTICLPQAAGSPDPDLNGNAIGPVFRSHDRRDAAAVSGLGEQEHGQGGRHKRGGELPSWWKFLGGRPPSWRDVANFPHSHLPLHIKLSADDKIDLTAINELPVIDEEVKLFYRETIAWLQEPSKYSELTKLPHASIPRARLPLADVKRMEAAGQVRRIHRTEARAE